MNLREILQIISNFNRLDNAKQNEDLMAHVKEE